jgi:sarcosine oxidase subunit beta
MNSKEKTTTRSLPRNAEVVIIGGGIIGVSIAYYLAKSGVRGIVLLEKGLMGEGSTGKCAGGIRTQFSTKINIQFSMISLKVFRRFREEFYIDPEFHRIGYLFLACSQGQWSILKTTSRIMESMGLKMKLMDRHEIRDRWSFLRTNDLSGGSYTENDGYAGPYEVLQGYIKGARRMGALLAEGIEVIGILSQKGKVRAVETRTGERIETPIVVNAAGPFASKVAAMLNLELPVIPLRRQLFFTDFFEEIPFNFPMIIDMQYGWYMRREGKGLLLSGPQDTEPSFCEKIDFEAQVWTANRSLFRVPVLERAGIANGWAGLYDISLDHHAIIGPFPEMEGFICANGFSGHGFMHGPAAGILVSELIIHGKTKTLDIHPLRPTRFREGDLIHEYLTAFK